MDEKYRCDDYTRYSKNFNVTLNPDIPTGQTDREVAKTTTTPMRIIDSSYEQVGNSACGGLCVRATLEKDKDYKDITVKISNTSACSNYENDKNKTTIVKFCTPLVCKEPNQHYLLRNELVASEAENSPNMIFVESRKIREMDKVERENLSSRINENLKNYKTRSYPDEELSETMKLESSIETKTAICSTDDETLRYNKSESQRSFRRDNENVDKNETATSNDTLINLRELMSDIMRADSRKVRKKCERSRSVPRGRSRESDFDYVKSNLSFPVCVDYSEATLTAADLTRPEFVQTLTEIKEYARNLEKQLSRINSAMRSTSLNDTLLDSTRVEMDMKKVTMNRDKIGENQNASLDTTKDDPSNELPCLVATAEISDKETKLRMKKIKDKDASSQSRICPDVKACASSLKKSKKSGLESAGMIRDEETQTAEAQKSKGSEFSESVSTADEAIMVKPSRIHKLKKSVESSREKMRYIENPKNFACASGLLSPGVSKSPTRLEASFLAITGKSLISKHPKSAPTQSCETNAEDYMQSITYIEDSTNFACANGRLCPGVSKSPTRLGASSLSITGKSLIPRRPKSASTQACETRAAVATSIADLHSTAPPTTPVDSEVDSELQRDPQLSPFSLNRSVLSRSRLRNRKNDKSPNHNNEMRSHSANSSKPVSVRDSNGFYTLHDNMLASDKSENYSLMETMKNDKNPMTPKPFAAFKAMKKTADLGRTNAKSLPKESKISYNKNKHNSSLQVSPGATKNFDQRDQTRTTNNSSQSRKLDKPAGKPSARRTSGIDYLRGRQSVIDNGRRSPSSSSNSPTSRSGKIDASDEFMENYPTSSKKLETVKTQNKAMGKLGNSKMPNTKLTSDSDKKSQIHQRSRSDPRETRNYAGRNSRLFDPS